MTRLPMESWRVVARPDLPAYELNTVDARPGSSAPATDDHHLWRRSFGADYRESWWVELEDGTLVPNRVGLSAESHELVERGGHRIVARRDSRGKIVFFWVTPERLKQIEANGENVYEAALKYGMPLWPQPGPTEILDELTQEAQADGEYQLTVEGHEIPHDVVVEQHTHKAGQVPEGSTCPTCERRVPHKKKQSSPQTKTKAYRVPIDDVEAHDEVLEAVAEHIGLGTKKPHWLYWAITRMAAVVLQLPAEQVRID